MRILILCKRQYTGKDLIDDQYGRLFEIPELLAQKGHVVKGLALSYRRRAEGKLQPKLVLWESINCIPFSPIGALAHLRKIRQLIREFNPDIIWASSDAWHIIAASLTAPKLNVAYIADLYDNYESFALTKLPFISYWLKKACIKADGVTCISHTLQKHLIEKYSLNNTTVIGNGINPQIFSPQEQLQSQRSLNLPENSLFIGTAGALTSNRGIDVLFQAFMFLATTMPNLYLVVAGPRDRTIKNYQHPRLIDMGNLANEKVPQLLSALDVAIICNLDSPFGNYCYPQKYEEIIACGTPLIAANVGEMPFLLEQNNNHLFEPTNAMDLSDKIQKLLRHNKQQFTKKPHTWEMRCDQLIKFISATLR